MACLACTGALAAVTTSGAAAQAPSIPGFAPASAARQAQYEAALKAQPSADDARALMHELTAEQGMAGTPGAKRRTDLMVNWLKSWGLQPEVRSYPVYLSKPKKISVTMTKPYRFDAQIKETGHPWQLKYDDVSIGFNGYSPSGDVKAPVVYANYGLEDDYKTLAAMGVDVKNKIVIARYGQSARGAKTHIAEKHGAAGVILYSDPQQDVEGPVYPDGPWRAPDGIQRGSLLFWWDHPGDPLTPGWAATKNGRRLGPSEATNLPRLPTTPVGYGSAGPILETLGGPAAPESWQGGLPFTYHVGGGNDTKVRLNVNQKFRIKPVRDVIVRIPGVRHPEQSVLVGGHYDAWTYGANDNGTGTVVTLQVAKALGQLLEQGWQPDRTIELALWDGEEYGMLGSTEYAEDRGQDLDDVLAYINLDGAAGRNFGASAVPSLDQLIVDASREVTWPFTGKSLYDSWSHRIGRLGSGSDYTAYLDHYGVPSLGEGAGSPGGEYHCACDDSYWMDHFGDPTYEGHVATTQMTGILALRLANADVPQYDYANYATQVAGYIDDLNKFQQDRFGGQVVSLDAAKAAAGEWKQAATALKQRSDGLLANGQGGPAVYDRITSRLMQDERALLTRSGMPTRPYMRHQVYTTGIDQGYGVEYLPGVRDALESGDLTKARAYARMLTSSLNEATALLEEANDALTS